jgi:aspartate carbamoyltransferase catalytic subunit
MQLAHPDAIITHPGPMNRDVKMTGEVANGPQSVIISQVSNGLAVRMTTLATRSAARLGP